MKGRSGVALTQLSSLAVQYHQNNFSHLLCKLLAHTQPPSCTKWHVGIWRGRLQGRTLLRSNNTTAQHTPLLGYSTSVCFGTWRHVKDSLAELHGSATAPQKQTGGFTRQLLLHAQAGIAVFSAWKSPAGSSKQQQQTHDRRIITGSVNDFIYVSNNGCQSTTVCGLALTGSHRSGLNSNACGQ
jgi:hypothetical protein